MEKTVREEFRTVNIRTEKEKAKQQTPKPATQISEERFYARRTRANSLEKTLMLGKTEGKSRRGRQRMRWLDGITDSMDINCANPRR